MRAQVIVAIIQTTLYVPSFAVSIYILAKNWRNRPRMAWYPMVYFIIFRLIGGIDVICLGQNPDSIALIAIALATLGVGLIPLIISVLGIIRTILDISSDNDDVHLMHRVIRPLRVAFGVAAGLLITGGSLVANSSTASTGRVLSEAGYVVFAAIIVVESGMLWNLRGYTTYLAANGSLIYFRGASFAMPPLFLRATYSLLSELESRSPYSTWNPVFGSSVAFALMALLPEYIVVVIVFYLGFCRIKQGKKPPSAQYPSSGR